jgi:hypothetical protein
VREDSQGKKLTGALLRALVQLIGRGAWVGTLGAKPVVDESDDWNFDDKENPDDLTLALVLPSLIELLPIIRNTLSALSIDPPQSIMPNMNAAEYMRGQIRTNVEALASLCEEKPELLWEENGQGTEMGDKLAFIFDVLAVVEGYIQH